MSLEERLAEDRALRRSRNRTKFAIFLDEMPDELRLDINEQMFRLRPDGNWYWSGEELVTSMMSLPEVKDYWGSVDAKLDARTLNKWRREHA